MSMSCSNGSGTSFLIVGIELNDLLSKLLIRLIGVEDSSLLLSASELNSFQYRIIIAEENMVVNIRILEVFSSILASITDVKTKPAAADNITTR